jgi:2-polyprenyl-3-methyl-5-hydroxy-6-metoxy-1,4-benzoquinol methylase|tara:strand:- start:693 stop:1592 length:900 start_codon:yes stop_codon:yes gene_type:complete
MIKKNCSICEKSTEYEIIYNQYLPKNYQDIDYSARKNPDNYHYEMVRCKKCSLLFASSIYEDKQIHNLYEISGFSYEGELKGLKETYGNCLKIADKLINNKKRLLDIGCGNGFLLEKAMELGWEEVFGIELSKDAINKANSSIKKNIYNGSFESNNYKDQNFDVIFFAMVIEHFADINKCLSEVYRILAPGGCLIVISHDEQHFLSKILKDRHPCINDEHVCVFNKISLAKILTKHNFIINKIKSLKNIYPLQYWLKMAPINNFFANVLLFILNIFGLGNINLGIHAGNIYCIAKKPLE